MSENTQYCTQCENHCPADTLRCGKGRRLFGVESEGSEPKHGHGRQGHARHGHGHHQPMEGALGLLQQCGHALHHGAVPETALDVLSADEQKQLEGLLSKLLASWNAYDPKNHTY